MNIDGFLQLVQGVRSVGSGRWIARCPNHNDKTPSLSIREGDKAILLRCWAGCSLNEICQALGIEPRNLFYDDGGQVDRGMIKKRQAERRNRFDWRAEAKALQLESDSLWMEAQETLSKFRGGYANG